MAKNPLHCSFCGRSRDEVKILIAGQDGHICENCVEHAREIIEQELMVKDEKGNSTFKLTVKKPMEIKKFLKPRKYWPWRFIITINAYNKKQRIPIPPTAMKLRSKRAIL